MKQTRNRYPLKKVVDRTGAFQVLLECGHTANPSTDMYGETCPVRQRCRKCYNNLPKDKE